MRCKAVCLLAAVVLLGCGEKKPETVTVGREFHSMQECINFIETDLKDFTKPARDTPDLISGFTINDRLYFICEAKVTGTRGRVITGRWDRLKEQRG